METNLKIVVEKKHPLTLRWNHWLNFPLLSIMVISGWAIYWASPNYAILPGEWIMKIGLGQNLGLALGWHFVFAVLFVVNGLAYSIFLLKTGHFRYLLPDRHSFKEAMQVFIYDLGFRRRGLPPQRKYNAAQRLTYTAVYGFGVLATATGFAIYKPLQLNWLLALLGGYESAKILHFIAMAAFVLFFVVHLLQVARSGWNELRAMITGLKVKNEDPS